MIFGIWDLSVFKICGFCNFFAKICNFEFLQIFLRMLKKVFMVKAVPPDVPDHPLNFSSDLLNHPLESYFKIYL